MSDLIRRSDLLRILENNEPMNWRDTDEEITERACWYWFKKVVEDAHAIEVEPVRHGEWVHTDKAASWKSKDECGECHYHTADRIDLSCFNYCPNCGAKMDGGEKDERKANFCE